MLLLYLGHTPATASDPEVDSFKAASGICCYCTGAVAAGGCICTWRFQSRKRHLLLLYCHIWWSVNLFYYKTASCGGLILLSATGGVRTDLNMPQNRAYPCLLAGFCPVLTPKNSLYPPKVGVPFVYRARISKTNNYPLIRASRAGGHPIVGMFAYRGLFAGRYNRAHPRQCYKAAVYTD